MSVADWITAGIGISALLSTGWFGLKGYQKSTADEERAAAAVIQQRITEARAEERARFDSLIDELRSDKEQALKDRDYERTRADNLQTLINQWRLDGRGGS